MPPNKSRSATGAPAPRRDEPWYCRFRERAETAKIGDHAIAILCGQRLIELCLRQRLAQQLGDVAVEIGAGLAKATRRPASGPRVWAR